MFQKLVAIEPVSLVPSAEKALYSFAGQVVMYPDIPANDDEIIAGAVHFPELQANHLVYK